MSLFGYSRVPSRQPQRIARLNSDIAGLVPVAYSTLTGALGQQINGNVHGLVNNPAAYTQIPTPRGLGEGNAGGLSGGFYPERYWTGITLAQEYTVFAFFYDRVGRNVRRALFDADDQTTRAFQFQLDSTNACYFIPFNTGGAPFIWLSAATTSATELNTVFARLGPSGAGTIVVNGVFESMGTLTGTTQTATGRVSFAQFAGSSGLTDWPFKDAILFAGIINRALTDGEIRRYTIEPWRIFASGFESGFYTASGGTTYNVSIIENVTALDSTAAAASFAASVIENVQLSSTISSLMAFNASISEDVQLSSTISATAVFGVSVSETSTAADTTAAALGASVYAASIVENAAAADVLTTNGVFLASVVENATVADTVVAGTATVFSVYVIESASATDFISAAGSTPSSFWTQIGTTQSAGWGQINNTQSSGWTIIPTT